MSLPGRWWWGTSGLPDSLPTLAITPPRLHRPQVANQQKELNEFLELLSVSVSHLESEVNDA